VRVCGFHCQQKNKLLIVTLIPAIVAARPGDTAAHIAAIAVIAVNI
jgi:hypothetical protein